MFLLGLAAGAIGTMLGIGGGSIISPTLIAIGIEPHVAVSSSLTAVLGTSLGGIRRLHRAGLVKVRIALLLETATIVGAFIGSYITIRLSGLYVMIIVAAALGIAGSIALFQPIARIHRRTPIALMFSFLAGFLSASAGIGGGVIKVPIMVTIMGLDLKAALATSKLMIGITASVGLSNYLMHKLFDPYIALPLTIGTFIGATLTSKLLLALRKELLRIIAASLYYTLMMVTLVRAFLSF